MRKLEVGLLWKVQGSDRGTTIQAVFFFFRYLIFIPSGLVRASISTMNSATSFSVFSLSLSEGSNKHTYLLFIQNPMMSSLHLLTMCYRLLNKQWSHLCVHNFDRLFIRRLLVIALGCVSWSTVLSPGFSIVGENMQLVTMATYGTSEIQFFQQNLIRK